jgi:hypothetical protein
MTIRLALVLQLLLGVAPASAQPPPRPPAAGVDAARALLSQAIDLYVIGRYREAAERLRPLVETRVLTDRADQGEALRAYGISLYLSGGREGAARAFRDLLRLEPTTRLDPAFVRPEVVSFFEGVRRQVRAEQNELIRKRGPKHSAAVNLIPPWGQFRNGHRTKAYVLLAGELAFTATSITTAALLYSWRGDDRVFRGREELAGPLTKINYISFTLVGVLLAYGIIDGLYYYYNPPPASRLKMWSATPVSAPSRSEAFFKF